MPFVAVGRPDLALDERLQGIALDADTLAWFRAELATAFATHTTTHWCQTLGEAGVRYAPVRNYAEVVADAGAWENGYFAEVSDEDGARRPWNRARLRQRWTSTLRRCSASSAWTGPPSPGCAGRERSRPSSWSTVIEWAYACRQLSAGASTRGAELRVTEEVGMWWWIASFMAPWFSAGVAYAIVAATRHREKQRRPANGPNPIYIQRVSVATDLTPLIRGLEREGIGGRRSAPRGSASP